MHPKSSSQLEEDAAGTGTPSGVSDTSAEHGLASPVFKASVVQRAASPQFAGSAKDDLTFSAKPDTLRIETSSNDGYQTPSSRSTLRLSCILLALFLSLFVAALDATIVATAVPVITHELSSATGYSWVGGAYLIGNAVGSPIWAKLSDIWGRKMIMLSAVSIFFASSTVCATATTMRTLIAGRALQGVAGGGLILLVHVVISDLFSVRKRSLFMGITEGVWAVAGGTGPPLGGLFSDLVSWRWCFYINLPICGIAFLLLFCFLDVRHEKTSFKTGLKAVDWFGIISFLAFSLMVLLGLDFGGDVFAWNSAKVICLIVIGTCMLGVFVYSEAKLAKHPLIPLALFRDRSNLAAIGVGAFHGLAFMPGEYYTPLYLQGVKQYSPVRSGVLLIPLVVATACVGVLAGVIIHRTGRYRELIWVGAFLLTLANGLFIMLDRDTSLGKFIGFTIIFGCGSGMLFEAPLIAIQSRSRQEDVATATSTFSFCRSIALSVSVIIGGVVFQNGMDAQSGNLSRAGLRAEAVEALSGKEAAANVALAGQLTDAMQRRAAERAFSWAMRNMWIMYTVLAFLGLLCGVFVGKAQLSRSHVETVTGIKAEKSGTTEDIALT
ncbi:hypothetical protein LTS08_002552 [Lithohypha guttulata]|nr:hypothetical protein LTS08_002552 [Lithohypha guttulata]